MMNRILLLALLALAAPRGAQAACGTGCLTAKCDPAAVLSYPVNIETKFSAPYSNYAAASNSAPMAYGICLSLGCNYRNVSLTFLNGDVSAKQDFVYRVTFCAFPGSSNLTAFPAALNAALPSVSTAAFGTIAYGMSTTTGGALSTLTGVYAGTGPFPTPPMPAFPSPAGANPPPTAASPPPPTLSPPPPTLSPPPPTLSPPPPTLSPPPPPPAILPVPPAFLAPGRMVVIPALPSISVNAGVVAFDGSASASSSAISAIAITVPGPVVGNLNIAVIATYAAADSHYRHLFNMDGLAAVLHQATSETEIWVGNNNNASVNCAAGFAVNGVWPANTAAMLVFSVSANGTVAGLTVNGTLAPPAVVDPMFMATSACMPISLSSAMEPFFVGGSGNVGYTDNWAGSISAFNF